MAPPRDFIDILQALLTPTIAAVAVGVAVAQWWTARNKLRLDLFDRRWAIYVATREMLAEMFRHGASTQAAQQKFLEGTRGARFLFDENIARYLEKELWSRVAKLEAANALIEAIGAPERPRAITAKYEIMEWLTKQHDATDALFDKFLRVDRSIFGRWKFW